MRRELLINFDLHVIAGFLQSLEEKIIFNLINRAQYAVNDAVYQPGKSGFADRNESLLDIRLQMQETMDAEFARYTVPEERPFTHHLPTPKRPGAVVSDFNFPISDFDIVNVTAQIKDGYLRFLPEICEPGSDGQFGSCVEHDVIVLQAISERIHFGAFYVAEAKYRKDPQKFQPLIDKKDQHALFSQLTRPEVESKILERVKEKVIHYQHKVDQSLRNYVNPDTIVSLYKQFIIPLTKEGEILFFLNRTDLAYMR